MTQVEEIKAAGQAIIDNAKEIAEVLNEEPEHYRYIGLDFNRYKTGYSPIVFCAYHSGWETGNVAFETLPEAIAALKGAKE